MWKLVHWKIVCWCLIVTCGVIAASIIGCLSVGAASVQPFTLESAAYDRNVAGELSMFRHAIFARRSDGAVASIEEDGLGVLPAGNKLPAIRKLTWPDSAAIWLIDVQRIRTTWEAATSGEAKFTTRIMANHQPDCGIPPGDIIGHETIWGQKTVVRLFDFDSDSRIKDWVSPELGCHIMQSQRIRKRDSEILSEERPVRVELREPDPSLFDSGGSYREVLPSVLLANRMRAAGLGARRTGTGDGS